MERSDGPCQPRPTGASIRCQAPAREALREAFTDVRRALRCPSCMVQGCDLRDVAIRNARKTIGRAPPRVLPRYRVAPWPRIHDH